MLLGLKETVTLYNHTHYLIFILFRISPFCDISTAQMLYSGPAIYTLKMIISSIADGDQAAMATFRLSRNIVLV